MKLRPYQIQAIRDARARTERLVAPSGAGKTLALATLLLACNKPMSAVGDLDGYCKGDGTCNSPALVCVAGESAHFCIPKPAPYESFCDTCVIRCADAGLHRCEVGDPSTWGGKPSVCECRP